MGGTFAICSSVVRMTKDNAKLLVLGSDDFAGFKELDSLPAGIEVVGLGNADEMLGLTLLCLRSPFRNKYKFNES